MPARAPDLRLVPQREETARTMPISARDDFELLACVHGGDDTAALELYDRLRPRVEGTIRRLVGRGDPDTDDLVQITFVEIVRTCDKFRGESSLDSWASAVAAHVAYGHIRRRRVERRIFSPDEEREDDAPPANSMRCIAARDALSRIREHLMALDEAKVWTFLLHDVCGFDLREIASITDVSVAAAQSRLVRGRRDVHERIARDPELADLLERERNGDP